VVEVLDAIATGAADGIGSAAGSRGIVAAGSNGESPLAEIGVGGVTLRMNGTGMFGIAEFAGATDVFWTPARCGIAL
jgi:hypothetical protein